MILGAAEDSGPLDSDPLGTTAAMQFTWEERNAHWKAMWILWRQWGRRGPPECRKLEPFSPLEDRSFMFQSQVQRKENLSFSFLFAVIGKALWDGDSHRRHTLGQIFKEPLCFACVRFFMQSWSSGWWGSLKGGGEGGHRWLFTFATSLWMWKCTNFVRLGFLKSRVP